MLKYETVAKGRVKSKKATRSTKPWRCEYYVLLHIIAKSENSDIFFNCKEY